MLGNRFTAHIAFHHSPTRERGELFFAAANPPAGGGNSADPVRGHDQAETGANTTARVELAGTNDVAGLASDVAHEVRAVLESNEGRERTPDELRRIDTVRRSVHAQVERVVGDILKLDALQHTAAENPLFSVQDIMQGQRSRILTALEKRFESEPTVEVLKSLPLIQAEFLRHSDQLEAFRAFVESTTERTENLSQNFDVLQIPPGKRPESLRGFYNPRTNTILLDKTLSGTELADVREHERGHAIMYAAEKYLNGEIFKGFIERVLHAATLDDRLQQLGAEYKAFGADSPEARDATLVRRYADARTRTVTEGSALEQALFADLDKHPSLQPKTFNAGWEERLVQDALGDAGAAQLLEDPTAFAAGVQALSTDADAGTEYAVFQGNLNALVRKLMARYQRWEGLSDKDKAERFPSAEETHLFRMLTGTQTKHLVRTAATALDDMRAKARRSAAMDTMLYGLGIGTNVSEKYRMYGDDRTALWEELLNRHADYRAGRDRESFTHLDEVALFSMIDPHFDARPPFTKSQIDARVAEMHSATPIPGNPRPGDRERLRATTGRKGRSTTDETAEETEEAAGEGIRISGHSLLDPLEKMEKLTNELREHMNGMEEIIRRNAKPDVADAIMKEVNLESRNLAEAALITRQWKSAASLIGQWENGDVPPATFLTGARAFLTTSEFETLERAMNELCPAAEWKAGTHDQKRLLARKLPTQEVLQKIKDDMKEWDEHLVKVSDYIKGVEDRDKANEAKRNAGGAGWEWFSLRNVFDAGKAVVDAYKKAFNEWSQLKESKLAKRFGDISKGFVGSDRALITLEMELDHKNDDTKDSFKKHLEHDLATFSHCAQGHHGHPSLLLETQTDANRFRGTLEYMASKGWLYALDIKNKTVFGIPLRIGVNLPANWSDERMGEYLRDLEQQQSKGESSEIDRGKSRVNNFSDIPPMIDALKDELERANYWATFGILERIVEKGKYPNSPVWASVVILNHIRNNGTAREFFPIKLLDKFGNNGLPNGMIHKFFKLDRHDMTRFQKNKNVPFEQAGTFAKISVAIEKEIVRLGEYDPDRNHRHSTDNDLILQKVSEVLAGQTAKGFSKQANRPWALNIYSDRPAEFKDYREVLNGFDNDINAKDLDDDYYNPKTDMTELVLGSTKYFYQILGTASEGAFKAGNKAQMFMEKLVVHFDKLLKQVEANEIPREALVNFQKETKEKMDNVYATWTQQTIQIPQYKAVTMKGNPPVLSELMRRRLIGMPQDLHKIPAKQVVDDFVADEKRKIEAAGEPFFIDIPPHRPAP